MSTILTPCFKGLEVFRDFIAPTPADDHTPSTGIYSVVGLFRWLGFFFHTIESAIMNSKGVFLKGYLFLLGCP